MSNSEQRTVTRQDVTAALVRLGSLPTRASEDAAGDLEMYITALQGARLDHLQLAITAIVRGSLGHGFLPSPPELRIETDRAAKAEAEQRARHAAEQRWRDEAHRYREIPRPSPEARARVQAMVDAFKRGEPLPQSDGR
ncbi:hypothetical protein [Oricola sp.]|uniref:hypothetical protein n=1 Tax=Oricola sp. TaxID=1979950 RepID=UPI0025EE2ABC|nr:hypothetical protein [Oricola sp.]MCI5078251.1 hypothetical protein [Oricola sp.]